ncbi:SurA N-terminal domain-containing protein [Desulfovibrio mangrovi]|uniref:SurA N-terminal domain-containing protein n=1 Tax=Desulfovibrio mangrovi TaxID=2976983 RepID=UPI002247EB02|nr:SurA N-terminal domain-containing protein [Desulfovibrio mangrovi]UZP68875.1 SurA N-terminal domain-containing protein [Desulfovibrio mangrovi]
MLDSIRQNAQSWGVKIAFALIIIVFIFWGVGSMSNSNRSSVLATVNEEPILIPEFKQAYDQQFAVLKRQIPGLKQEDLKQLGFAQQVMQQLVSKKLILQEAERLGIAVTPQELKKTIASIAVFRNEKDVFDGDLYKRVLEAQGMTPGQFEESYRQDILIRKMQEYVGLPASVTADEARTAFNFAGERRSIEFTVMPAASFVSKVTVAPEKLQEFYDQNKEQFKQPAKVALEYITITPKSLAKGVTVDEAEIAAFYDQNAETYFVQDESVRARHILVLADANAPEAKVAEAKAKIEQVLAQVKKGGDFAALAKKYSEGPSAPNGGDLGEFGHGAMVKPFEDAAFALDAGQVSGIVRTQFGFHIIKVEEKTPRRVKALAEVHDEIRQRLAEDKAADKVADSLDVVFEEVMAGKSMADAAAAHNLDLRTTSEFPRAKAMEVVGIKPDSLDAVFGTIVGGVVETPLEVEGGYMVARVSAASPESYIEFDQVKTMIEGRLLQEAAMQMAADEAKKIAEDVASGKLPAELAATVQTSPLFDRRGFVPGLGQAPELVNAVFAASGDQWGGPFMSAAGAVFFHLKDTSLPSDKEWEVAEEQVMASMLRAKRQEMFRAFMNDLGKKAEILIQNQDFLDKI